MPIFRRWIAAAALVCVAATGATANAAAQASPYLPLDDPRLPLLEHLIARGDIADPSPFVRPFRRADAARVLAAADTNDTAPSTALIRELRRQLEEPAAADTANRWLVEGRAGGQAYTAARRDPLHPAGDDGARPYVDLRLEGIFGPIVLATRPAIEPRLKQDPDWPGRHDANIVGRMVDAYASAQFKWGSLFYGQMDRNWGPTGVPGISLSDYGYSRPTIAFDVGGRTIRLMAQAADLRDTRDADDNVIHRYFFAHRLGVQFSNRWHVAVWETTVLAGRDRLFEGRFRNPVSLLLLGNQYGLGDERANIIVGLDARWRASRRATIEAQLALDDLQYENRGGPNRYPDRWAFTVAGYGPLGRRLAWRALYTQASSLAFRTFEEEQNFTDVGVGLGRNFADNDQLSVFVTVPVRDRWLLTPELTVLRQGEGRINDPFPATPEAAGQIPQLFIGTVERTYRVALGVTGRGGPLDLQGNIGFHHVSNAGNVPGASDDRVEARLQATLRFTRRGTVQ